MTDKLDAPEKRYVWLHRAIEQGNANDAIWAELSRVCHRLGHVTEAIKALRNIEDPEALHRAEMYLVQRGVLERPSGVLHAARERQVETHATGFVEQVQDAFAYLFVEHMPYMVMAATLTFPVVLGIGGILASGTAAWVFPAIALLPVLCIVGLVGALARQIVVDTSRGSDEPVRVPKATRLVHGGTRFLRDCLLVSLALIGPGVLAWQFGLIVQAILLLAVGGLLAPMAMAVSQVRNDWRGLAPSVLLPAVVRCRSSYMFVAMFCGLIFTPAAVAVVGSSSFDLYLRMSFVGPLAIAPLFVVARLMGRVLHTNSAKLGALIEVAPQVKAPVERPPVAPEPRPQPARQPKSAARPRPASTPASDSSARQKPRRRPAPQHAEATARPASAKPAPAGTPTKATAQRRQPPRKQPTQAAPPSNPGEPTARAKKPVPATPTVDDADGLIPDIVGEDTPDLLNIPGATAFTGADRANSGAASGPRRS